MERKIKYWGFFRKHKKHFRIWDMDTKSMDFFTLTPRLFYDSYYNFNRKSQDQGNLVIMQSTGLWDKFSRTIYEGDILKVSGTDDDYDGIVVYEHNEFCTNHGKNRMKQNILGYKPKYIEIIGNVFREESNKKESIKIKRWEKKFKRKYKKEHVK